MPPLSPCYAPTQAADSNCVIVARPCSSPLSISLPHSLWPLPLPAISLDPMGLGSVSHSVFPRLKTSQRSSWGRVLVSPTEEAYLECLFGGGRGSGQEGIPRILCSLVPESLPTVKFDPHYLVLPIHHLTELENEVSNRKW